jgi:hypothetical protein
MNYTDKVYKEESEILAIDFDGVIHENNLGFHDGTIYGDILPGAKSAIMQLAKQYKLVIYTAKAKVDRPLINGKTGVELIWEWLEMHSIDKCIHSITAEKPRSIVYIDDKAIRFEDWDSTMELLDKLYGIS